MCNKKANRCDSIYADNLANVLFLQKHMLPDRLMPRD